MLSILGYITNSVFQNTLVCTICSLIVFKILQLYRDSWRLSHIPGTKGWPLLGNFTMLFGGKDQFTVNGHYVLLRESRKYESEGLFKLTVGPFTIVMLNSPETIKVITNSKVNVSRGFSYQLARPDNAAGIILTEGEEWRRDRKLINPAFHSVLLDKFIPSFNEHSRILISKLTKDGHVRNAHEFFSLYALDVVLETTMGARIGVQLNPQHRAYRDITVFLDKMRERLLNPLMYNDFIYFNLIPSGHAMKMASRGTRDLASSIIEKRKKTFLEEKASDTDAEAKQRRRPLLDSLLELHFNEETSHFMDDKNVIDQITNFIGAGFETTGTTLSFAFNFIARHPEVQRKLQAEVDEHFPLSATDDEHNEVTSELISKMIYTEACIKEAQRLVTPITISPRKIGEDVTIKGHLIPKGTETWLFLGGLHRRADEFDDPDEFKPERWMPDYTGHKPSASAFLPFSAGIRDCPGQRFAMNGIRTLVPYIIRQFEVQVVNKEPTKAMLGLVTAASKPIQLRFIPREIKH